MKKHYLALLLWLCLPGLLTAQNTDSYSIQQLDSMASALQQQQRFAQAIPFALASAEKTAQQFGKDSLYADKLFAVGMQYYSLYKYEEALPYWQECKDIRFASLGKYHPKSAKAINALALLYRDLEDVTTAEKLHFESREIRAKVFGVKHPEYAKCLSNMGNLYQEQQRYEEAEQLFLEAREIWQNSIGKETYDYSGVLNNLGILYYNTSQNQKAEEVWLETKAIREKIFGKKHPQYAIVLDNLGNLYTRTKQYDLAEQSYLEANTIFKQVLGEENPEYARMLNNLAAFYEATLAFDKAEKIFQQAGNLYRLYSTPNSPPHINHINSFADFYEKKGDYARSWQKTMEAIAKNAYQDSIPQEIDAQWVARLLQYDYASYSELDQSLRNLLELSKKQNRPLEYRQWLEQLALGITQKWRDQLSGDGDKLNILRSTDEWAIHAIHTAQKRHAQGATEALIDAFSFAEASKSALLADALQSEKAHQFGNLPDELLAREQALQKRLSATKAELAAKQSPERESQLRSQLNTINAEVYAFRDTIAQNYPQYNALKYQKQTIKASDIQALLDDKTALLEYTIGKDSAFFVFYIDKKQVECISIPQDSDSLTTRVDALRKALSNYTFIEQKPDGAYQLYTQTAHWFYQQLVAPALQKAQGIEHLIIVPDKGLGHLPFETFLVEAAPEKGNDYGHLHYLLRDYAISYSYSAALWKENRQAAKPQHNGELLAFAADYQAIPEGSPLRSLRAAPTQNLRDALVELPEAKKEVELLARWFYGKFVTGATASEKQFKQAIETNYAVIHLALHGLLDKKSPILSSLAFTEDGDSSEDNFLRAYEISNLSLTSQLVVLSACETGYGKFAQGEGVLSLARSFMYAGVPSLVVSLWSVNDASTSSIMRRFYENLAQGMDKARALQDAKMSYLRDNKGIAGHPAYWSPFVQMGDSEAVSLKQRPSRWWWWGLTGIAVVVGVVGWRKRRK